MIKVLASGSDGNCYLISTENEILILECGIKYKNILEGLNYDISKVVGCLVSHEHKDHSKSIKSLINKGINVYASRGTISAYFKDEKYMLYRAKPIKAGKAFGIGGFTILPFEIQHDAKEPLGFLIFHKEIGKILFLTDTCYCKYTFKKVNYFLVECNYLKEFMDNALLKKRIYQSHFELQNTIDFLKSCDLSVVKGIMLIHLSSLNADKDYFKKEVERAIGFPVKIAEKWSEM